MNSWVPDIGGLQPEDLERLRADTRVAFVVDEALRIRWVNHPIEGWGPGRSVLEAIAPPLDQFYRDFFFRVLEADAPQDHVYQCHTPELFRRFCLRAYPLRGEGLLLVHSCMERRPHDEPSCPPDPDRYTDAQGMVVMCAHCRRVRRKGHLGEWDWVPGYVEEPPGAVTHGLCEACFAYYFPA